MSRAGTADMTTTEDNAVDQRPDRHGPITQIRLKQFHQLQAQFYDVRSRYYAAYEQLQRLMVDGSEIRMGLYKPQAKIRSYRRPHYKQVVIDLKGEAYQRRILEATEPNYYYRITVE